MLFHDFFEETLIKKFSGLKDCFWIEMLFSGRVCFLLRSNFAFGLVGGVARSFGTFDCSILVLGTGLRTGGSSLVGEGNRFSFEAS